jgi:hypothetical protein
MQSRLDLVTIAAGTLVALAAGADAVAAREPSAERDPPAQAAAILPATAPPSAPPSPACEPLAFDLPDLVSVPDLDRPVPPIEEPTGEAMAPFYEKLAGLLRGRATDHLRIAVYGDSNGTLDYTTGEMRRWLQGKFGDAGHGYVALAQVWPWYEHRDVERGSGPGWEGHAVSTNWLDDDLYGHGLIVAQASTPHAETWVATASSPSRIGLTVSKVGIAYLRRPGGGAFDVLVDGKVSASIDTDAPRAEAGFVDLDLPDAPHRVTCVARDHRPLRLLGATLERAPGSHPSFVVDALGVGGASWRTMLRDDPDLDAQTLRRRAYDLVVLHVGTNTWKGELRRAATMRSVIDRLKAALPSAPVLVMDPPDHHDDYALMDEEIPPEQRKIALEKECAFFDFHAAMGGRHAMDRFFSHGMSRGDMIHFNEAGGAYMARRVLYAIWRDFALWLRRHAKAGCP